MDKILVPVDFSDTSSNALRYAIELFGASATEITVLHIYGTTSNAALLMKNIDGVLENDAKQKMNELLEQIEKEYPAAVLKPTIIKNSAVSAIVALGDSGNFNYVVMGTKGASGLKEVFMGSVAGGVISKTSAPVLVVPTGHSFRKLDEIVLAVGERVFSDKEILAPLRRILTLHQSKLKVLHIAEKEHPDIKNVLDDIQDLNPSIEYAFGTGNTHRDLNDYLLNDYSGLLCLIREKKGFFERLLDGSVTLKQTFDSPVPLLILHD